MSKQTEERRDEIYHMILEEGCLRVKDLAQRLHVTTETIRKDLNAMDERGIIQKNHGEAMIRNDYYQLPLDVKMNEHAAEKQQIARAAISLIKDNSIIYMDPGSTTLCLAKYLRLKKGLTIVTNSLAIAQMVSDMHHELIVVGGRLQKKGKSSVGVYANHIIDTISIDTAFMGCDGFLGSDGPTTFSLEEMEVKQHVIRKAQMKVLLCDASKFTKRGMYTFARFDDYDVMITSPITKKEAAMVQNVKKLIIANDLL